MPFICRLLNSFESSSDSSQENSMFTAKKCWKEYEMYCARLELTPVGQQKFWRLINYLFAVKCVRMKWEGQIYVSGIEASCTETK